MYFFDKLNFLPTTLRLSGNCLWRMFLTMVYIQETTLVQVVPV